MLKAENKVFNIKIVWSPKMPKLKHYRNLTEVPDFFSSVFLVQKEIANRAVY